MMTMPQSSSEADLLVQAEQAWDQCEEPDWLEAFSHHPKIGDLDALRSRFNQKENWASEEQSGALDASEETLQELAEGNHRYEQKFGFIFIVNATNKTAEEMLEMLRHRMKNTRDLELRVAAQEQLKITKIRLQKLFES